MTTTEKDLTSSKSACTTFVLASLFGILGVHRLYVGKIGTGLLMLVTGGGFGIWLLVDLIAIVSNTFEDKQDKPVILYKNRTTIKKVLSIFMVLLLTIIQCIALITLIVIYSTSGLVAIVDDQLAAIKAGDIQKAYTYTSKAFQKNVSIEEFEKFLDGQPDLKHVESHSFTSRSISVGNGTGNGMLAGTLTTTDGKESAIQYDFIKENEQWKITNINLHTPEHLNY